MSFQIEISTKVLTSVNDICIAKINPNSLSDYKGEFALTMFYAGCNLTCSYCFNKDLWSKEKAIASVGEILNRAYDDDYHTAIVLCGGEATIYPVEHHIKFIKTIYPATKVKLFTNGVNTQRIINCINNGLDSLSIDYKYYGEPNAIGLCNTNTYHNNMRSMFNIIDKSDKYPEITLNTVIAKTFSDKEIKNIREDKIAIADTYEKLNIILTETEEVQYG